jgi:hypothetical protein
MAPIHLHLPSFHCYHVSAAPADRLHVLDLVKQADVAVLLYDVDNMETFNRISDYWLPEIQKRKEVPSYCTASFIDLLMPLFQATSCSCGQ